MEADKAQAYVKLFEQRDSARDNWKSTWQKIGDYILPLRGDILSERAIGAPRHTLIYDGTAQQASDVLVAGLFSYLTSPYMPWFRLVPRDQAILNDEQAGLWMQDAEQRMYFMFAMTNFYKAIATMYQDLVNINHGIVYVDEDTEKNQLTFTNLSPRDCVILENKSGRVDKLMRKIKWRAEQAYQEFGEKASADVKKDASENPDKKYDFLHTVMPREKYNKWQKDSLNMPFESCYIDMKEKKVLDEGGYREFPFVVPRWSTYADDVYGTCPGINALNDVKTLNKEMELYIMQAEKALNPPLDITSGYKDRIRTMAGGLNVRSKSGDEIKPIITAGRVEISDKVLNDLRHQVKEHYFVSTFLMLADMTQRMTAYEVSSRENEKMMMLGPGIGRITDECLGPLIDRCFGIMMRGGYFLPAPESVMEHQIDVEYLSPLARAQKAVQAQSVDRLVAFMAPLTQLFPDIADNFNPDEAARFYADVFNVPKTIVRGAKAIQAMREERTRLQQQEVVRQQMLEATEGIKNIAESDRAAAGDQSILQQLMGGML